MYFIASFMGKAVIGWLMQVVGNTIMDNFQESTDLVREPRIPIDIVRCAIDKLKVFGLEEFYFSTSFRV